MGRRKLAPEERKHRRPLVNWPERKCANPECGIVFKPARKDQRFHTVDCRKRYWQTFYTREPHRCPFCQYEHSPTVSARTDRVQRIPVAVTAAG